MQSRTHFRGLVRRLASRRRRRVLGWIGRSRGGRRWRSGGATKLGRVAGVVGENQSPPVVLFHPNLILVPFGRPIVPIEPANAAPGQSERRGRARKRLVRHAAQQVQVVRPHVQLEAELIESGVLPLDVVRGVFHVVQTWAVLGHVHVIVRARKDWELRGHLENVDEIAISDCQRNRCNAGYFSSVINDSGCVCADEDIEWLIGERENEWD